MGPIALTAAAWAVFGLGKLVELVRDGFRDPEEVVAERYVDSIMDYRLWLEEPIRFEKSEDEVVQQFRGKGPASEIPSDVVEVPELLEEAPAYDGKPIAVFGRVVANYRAPPGSYQVGREIQLEPLDGGASEPFRVYCGVPWTGPPNRPHDGEPAVVGGLVVALGLTELLGGGGKVQVAYMSCTFAEGVRELLRTGPRCFPKRSRRDFQKLLEDEEG